MSLKQLSVFVENTKGAMYRVTSALAKEGVDIKALSVADTANYGILRLIVSDLAVSRKVLTEIGCLVQETDVVCVLMEDKPGRLAAILSVLDKADMNIDYLYAFLTPRDGKAYVIIRVDDVPAAEAVLTSAGYSTVSG